MNLYKGFTHDLRPPVQGGAPVWDGRLPYVLPAVKVDESSEERGAGWNACRSGAAVLKIAGMWPNGRPLRLFRVEAEEVVERSDKVRFGTGRIVEEVEDVTAHVREFTAPWAVDLTEEMVWEQMCWREALGRVGKRDEGAVEAGLRVALEARGLKWELKRYATAWAAWDAWAASAASAARAAWAAWAASAASAASAAWAASAARDAWDAGAARDARAAWAAGDARDAMDAWAARDAWVAWDARDARAGLVVYFAARKGWVKESPDRLTVGIRDAHYHGLAVACHTAENTLAWAMEAA